MTDTTESTYKHAWEYPVVITDDEKEKSITFYEHKGHSWYNLNVPGFTHPQIYHFQVSHIKGMARQILEARALEEGDTEAKLLRRCAVVNHLHDLRNATCKYTSHIPTGQITFTFASKQGDFYKTLLRRLREEGIYHQIHDKLALNPDTPRRLGVRVEVDLTAPSARY